MKKVKELWQRYTRWLALDKKKWYKNWKFWLSAFIVILFINSCSSDESAESNSSSEAQVEQTTNDTKNTEDNVRESQTKEKGTFGDYSEDQFDAVVAFAQVAIEKVDDDSPGYYKEYEVSKNETVDGKKRWVVVYQDGLERYKYICEWDGDTDNLEHKNLYLLIRGNEIYNHLNE